ncbi:MAG: type II secretion system F family protein [Coriobacteriales bacterium]|jgi:type IV pilus assembly protein PilC|nr:type II secretion system F family protein [Coriobacteriales bacterium]
MPQYKYTAFALNGKRVVGSAEAASPEQLASLLRTRDLFLQKATSSEKRATQQRLKVTEIADFSRQLAAMLSAGIMLIRAMTILAQRNLPANVKRVYGEVIADLQRGATLSEAMGNRGRAFPELLVNMIRAGENTGRLDVTAAKMAASYDKEHRLNSKIRGAIVYPAILLVLIIGVVLIIFTFVIPSFIGIFEDMELPLPTQIVMGISDFLLAYGVWLLIGIVIVIAALIALFRRPRPRRAWDHFKLKIPKVGRLLKTIYTARFARTLASLYVSGISMIQALQISRRTIGNTYIESQFDAVIELLGNGRTLSQALSGVDGFEPKLESTILIGEESGSLEQMLESIADQYDYDSEMAAQKLVTFIEPVLIVFMALIVGFVIISVLLPIYQLYDNVGAQGGI